MRGYLEAPSVRRSVIILLYLGITAALLYGAWTYSRSRPALPPGGKVRLRVAFVSGFSWERVIPLRREGRLPFLDSLFLEKGSYGDVFGRNFRSETAVTASLITGRFPWKHGIRRPEDLKAAGAGDSLQGPVWRILTLRDQPSGAIGFPMIPPGDDGVGLFYPGDEGGPHPPRVGKAPEDYIPKITGGRKLPGDLRKLLLECLAADLSRLEIFRRLEKDESLHLFLYFDGLGRWQKNMLSGKGSLPETERWILLDNYYVFFDGILAGLLSRRGEGDLFMLISERGNIHGHPSYPKYYPRLIRYPPMGFFYASGAGIRRGALPLTISPVDLVPTILYMTGNPVQNDMDGRVIFFMLEENRYFKQPPIFE